MAELDDESRRLLFEEGSMWVPFFEDGIAHERDHVVFAPQFVLVMENMEKTVMRFLDVARENGKKGAIIRIRLADGRIVRVMMTVEGT